MFASLRGLALFAFTLALVLGTSACGSGGRQLQSVTISPTTARSQAAFTATGAFSKPPSPVPLTSKDVMWCAGTASGACAGNINPGATVDQNGRAQCVPGFAGTATILAGTAAPSMMPMPDTGPQLNVFGAAQLACP